MADRNTHALTLRLARWRRGTRALALMHGMGSWIAFAIASTGLTMTIDWLVPLPGLVRLVVLLTLLFVLIVAAGRRIVRPLLVQIDLREIASAMDRRIGGAQDRLATALEFITSGRHARSPLTARVLAEADGVLAGSSLRSLFDCSKPLRSTAAALVALTCVLWLSVEQGDWLRTGVRRIAMPFGDAQWPPRVVILPITGDQVIARGEPVTLAMRLERGDSPRRTAMLVRKSPDGGLMREPLVRSAAGQFEVTLASPRASFDYWFVAGDGTTEQRPHRVEVRDRPAIVQAEFDVTPPAYTGWSSYADPAVERSLSVFTGSRVSLRINTSQPIRLTSEGEADAELRMSASDAGGPATVRMTPIDTLRRELSVSWTARSSARLSVHTRDEYGLENRDPPYTMNVQIDQPPEVMLVSLGSGNEAISFCEVTASATVRMKIAARDDVGVRSLHWIARRNEHATLVVDLSDQLPSVSSRRETSPSRTELAYDWSLAPLSLHVGDTLTCHAEASDAFALDGQTHAPVQSQPIELRIVGADRVLDRLVRQSSDVTGMLSALVEQQKRVRHDTVGLREFGETDQERARRAAALAGEQRDLMQQAHGAAGRLADLMQEARDNGLLAGDPNRASRLRRLDETQQRVEAIAQSALSNASDLLNRLAADSGLLHKEHPSDVPEQAVAQQDQAIDRIQKLLDELSAWRDTQAIVERTQQLLDRQASLTRRAAQLPASRPVEAAALPVGEVRNEPAGRTEDAARSEASYDQRRLARDTEAHLQRMNEAGAELRNAAAVASDDSVQAGDMELSAAAQQAQSSVEQMDKAAEAIARAQAEIGTAAQRAAEEDLRKLLEHVAGQDRRELAELSKRAADAKARLRELIEDQDRLVAEMDQMAQASDAQGLRSLRKPQTTLCDRTDLLIPAVAQAERTGQAMIFVGMAAVLMKSTAGHLARMNGVDAAQSGREAGEHLQRALDSVTDAGRAADRQLAKFALDEIRAAITAIRANQESVNMDTGRIEDRRVESKADSQDRQERLSFDDARLLTHLGEQEAGIAQRTAGLQERLAGVVVGGWMIADLAERMRGIQRLLELRETGPGVQREEADVLDRMDLLIAAVTEERDREDSDFETGGGGGEGSEAAEAKNPMPKLAELRLLKLLQQDLLRRTRRFHGVNPSEALAEVQLREIQRLGEEQLQLRALTLRLVGTEAQTP